MPPCLHGASSVGDRAAPVLSPARAEHGAQPLLPPRPQDRHQQRAAKPLSAAFLGGVKCPQKDLQPEEVPPEAWDGEVSRPPPPCSYPSCSNGSVSTRAVSKLTSFPVKNSKEKKFFTFVKSFRALAYLVI